MSEKAKRQRRRPGRPLAEESLERQTEIVNAARTLFGRHGYDGTSLSAVASATGVTLAALYHYVDGKPELYRLVHTETLSRYWEDIQSETEAAKPDPTFRSQLSAFVRAVGRVAKPEGNDFLASVGIETRRHPEFEDLGKERDRVREPVFASLLEKALAGGSLSNGGAAHELMMLRILIMGWAHEKNFNPDVGPQLDAALLDLADVLDRAKRPATGQAASEQSDTDSGSEKSSAGTPRRSRLRD